MTKEEKARKKKLREIQKALDDFPRIVKQKKDAHKRKLRILKKFEPLVKELKKLRGQS